MSSNSGFLDRSRFNQPVDEVARDLIGRTLFVSRSEMTAACLIVETEAYGGPEDPASHAAFKPGGGARLMFQEAGLIYVFLAYGMYPCLNIVTGDQGVASAVLIRGAVVDGEQRPILGPGKLGRRLGATISDNGLTTDGPVYRVSTHRSELDIVATPRIGISRAVDTPWRFIASLD